MAYVVHIGLEIHVHLNTNTKMFCSCKAQFGEEANTHICPVCMGLPGALPVPNEEAIIQSLQIAQALSANLATELQFDRKNYFYPDMPKNYQITQYVNPMGREGVFRFYHNSKLNELGIREMHLEEDAGKLIHADDASYADYNRAGYPLMEVVTKPELRSPEEAEVMVQQFHKTVQYLGVCDGNMEEGALRCDVNISLSSQQTVLGEKVEIKNVNSFQFIRKALQFEIQRQTALLDAGEKVAQETRLWNENKDITESMRSKEDVHDYRYLQEPDIPRCPMPEDLYKQAEQRRIVLPVERLVDLIEQHALAEKAAWLLTEDKALGDVFYHLCGDISSGLLARWITEELRTSLKKTGHSFVDSGITEDDLQEFFQLLKDGDISERKAKQLVQVMTEQGGSPRKILKQEGWLLLTDEQSIQSYVDAICTEHGEVVEQVRIGQKKGFDFLMGALMKASKGQIHPRHGREILERTVYKDA